MAENEFGELPFTIHGGGSDLVFPHHENEIAQSEAARGRPLARIWMHNGMIETDQAKMSKSDGNIFQLHEAIDRYGAEAVVSYLISGHYRQPLAFGPAQLEEAVARVDRLRNFLRGRDLVTEPGEEAGSAVDRFRDALADDFNTPRAMGELFDLVRAANQDDLQGSGSAVREMLDLVGLGSLSQTEGDGPDAEALELLEQRQKARAERDFEAADRIRDRLAELGWQVRDADDGATLVPIS